MPAIVGRDYRRTPEFSGKLSYIEINPFWTVPPKLAREDILPKVRKDPFYLENKGIRVFKDWSRGAPEIGPDEVDWSKVKGETMSFKFRQDPGPRTRWAGSSSCSPTSSTSTCTTRRNDGSSRAPSGISARAVSASRSPWSWPNTY